MSKPLFATPNLDELEKGPWPSFVTGLKRLAKESDMMHDLLCQLETSYKTKTGYWKGGTVGVFGYGGGVIPRFTELKDEHGKPVFPEAAEFHTLRIQPPAGMHYTSDLLRKMCDVWQETGGSGLIAFHGQSGDIMFQGIRTENVQKAFDRLNEMGFDLGGAGPSLRTSMSCVGAARCEMSCYDEAKALRTVINNNIDDMHRPSLPYKFKFKFSGCPNDCVNAIMRSDLATIGTWRDNIRVDEDLVQAYYKVHGMEDLINDVVTKCPTKAITLVSSDKFKASEHVSAANLGDGKTLCIDNKNCVRCMHCLNVMPGGLLPGKDKGVTILIGGKGVLKIGATMGTVVIPFMKLETDEDFEKLNELGRNVIDFFAENALEHERTGEMIERIGLTNFLEGLELPVDPNMITQPRANPFFRSDDWDEQVEKWLEYKASKTA
ncbi:dissimilatory-type sulfite reductase subunit alpha [Thiobacillus sp.]|uniref:dissimilatory-type sulfite reductase subunit alpha n=1 Tax=Thiobacillus sp. TaxID=924 RepID=UPI0017C0A57D|nr:dissimilatory-type sulfite reductase subunit alpha [Thiobacillus sp.]MBC2732436.1 dissimilatory-type sulfite reductase subunit alpha [Thiobacillus sp.]MBC2741174.1 dissimilatory-type sulfite reductase subunit alpha [Thiobacillus sp.]MBC2759865.1 dissimilatory-type sulfite reductase subunit alpha [Thiobacillus sp.]